MNTRASLIRFGAAIGIAAMLLLLSVIFHRAMASDPGNSQAYLWGTWIFVIALTFVIAFSARSVRTALGRLCLLNGGATALVAFNGGVECGQLTVITGAFLVVGWWRNRKWYRQAIVIPASALIAATGLFWTVQRVALALR